MQIKKRFLYLFSMIFLFQSINSMEDESLIQGAKDLYNDVSKFVKTWYGYSFSSFHNDIADKKMTPTLATFLVLESSKFALHIALSIYSINKIMNLGERHDQITLSKIALSLYGIYRYVSKIKNECQKFLNFIHKLKKYAPDGELMENKKGEIECSICHDRFYNCPQCLATFHPKCLSEYFEDKLSAGALFRVKCPKCEMDLNFEEIDKLAKEDDEAKIEAEKLREQESTGCIIQ